MRFMVNASLAEGVSRTDFIQSFEEHGVSPEAWKRYQDGVITSYLFKIGEEPGFVLFLDAESAEEAAAIVEALPVSDSGLVDIRIDPVSTLATFE